MWIIIRLSLIIDFPRSTRMILPFQCTCALSQHSKNPICAVCCSSLLYEYYYVCAHHVPCSDTCKLRCTRVQSEVMAVCARAYILIIKNRVNFLNYISLLLAFRKYVAMSPMSTFSTILYLYL